jgi:hypothetical protein
MEQTPDSQKTSRPKVSVNEHKLLVTHSKSKKLAAIANKSAPVPCPAPKPASFSALKADDSPLQQARQLIDTRIQALMNSLPEGRRTKLFTIRFDTVANIKNLEIKAAFKLLDINPEQLNTRALAGLNYHGDSV